MIRLPTESEPVVLIHGDSMNLIHQVPALVGALIMDPPYGIAHQSSHGASWQNTEIANDRDTNCRDFMIEWAERHKLPWASFGTWKVPSPPQSKITLVWDKGPAFGMGDLNFPWKNSWEEIYVGGNGWRGSRDEGVLRGHLVVSWESKGRVHPHQKPVSLIRYLLSKLPPDRIVFDPYMVSGSVGVACVQSGFKYIGIEIDPEHYANAKCRIGQAMGEGTLFPPRAPIAEPLFI